MAKSRSSTVAAKRIELQAQVNAGHMSKSTMSTEINRLVTDLLKDNRRLAYYTELASQLHPSQYPPPFNPCLGMKEVPRTDTHALYSGQTEYVKSISKPPIVSQDTQYRYLSPVHSAAHSSHSQATDPEMPIPPTTTDTSLLSDYSSSVPTGADNGSSNCPSVSIFTTGPPFYAETPLKTFSSSLPILSGGQQSFAVAETSRHLALHSKSV